MPTYEYRCEDCGHEFEIFQGMLEKKLTTCPSCAGRVKRLIGAGAGIVFRGSGFYQTDYRGADYRARAREESGDGKRADAKPPVEGTPARPDAKPADAKTRANAKTPAGATAAGEGSGGASKASGPAKPESR